MYAWAAGSEDVGVAHEAGVGPGGGLFAAGDGEDDEGRAGGHIARGQDRLCSPFSKRVHDPSAPYDAYDESDDTEQRARSGFLKPVSPV